MSIGAKGQLHKTANGVTLRKAMDLIKQNAESEQEGFLDAKMLVAMPGIEDSRFERSVIFLCAHSENGAMGIVINKPAENITFTELLSKLNIVPGGERIELPNNADDMHVHFGGPVETGRGFVLHSSDYFIDESTLPIDNGIGLTATLDVLKAIARGNGPRHALLALGYAGWGPGQLEEEILHNGWLHCEPDMELIFSSNVAEKYDLALRKIGIDPLMLSGEVGHA